MSSTENQLVFRGSAAARIALCAGSERAQVGLHERTDPALAALSEAGERVHEWLMKRFLQLPLPALSSEEEDTAETLYKRAVAMLEPHGGIDITKSFFEHKFSTDLPHGRWTGRPDLVAVCMDGAVVLPDYKSGWMEYTPAEVNAQLRVYVCLIDTYFNVAQGDITAQIVSKRRSQPALYKASDIASAYAELDAIAEAAQKPDAPRTPSTDACRYCRAFGTSACPESTALMTSASASLAVAAADVAALPAAKLASLLDLAPNVVKLCKIITDEAKARLKADINSIPGFGLKDGATQRKVEDTAAAVVALAALPEDLLYRALKLSVSDLEAELHAAKKATGEKWTKDQCKAYVEQTLGDLIQRVQNEPSLKKIG